MDLEAFVMEHRTMDPVQPNFSGGIFSRQPNSHCRPSTISPLGIMLCFCLYKTREDVKKHIVLIKVLRGVSSSPPPPPPLSLGPSPYKTHEENKGATLSFIALLGSLA